MNNMRIVNFLRDLTKLGKVNAQLILCPFNKDNLDFIISNYYFGEFGDIFTLYMLVEPTENLLSIVESYNKDRNESKPYIYLKKLERNGDSNE